MKVRRPVSIFATVTDPANGLAGTHRLTNCQSLQGFLVKMPIKCVKGQFGADPVLYYNSGAVIAVGPVAGKAVDGTLPGSKDGAACCRKEIQPGMNRPPALRIIALFGKSIGCV